MAMSSPTTNIEIVELGGGRGTNACLILDHLQSTVPDLYERCTYAIIDHSKTLLELQEQTLSTNGRHSGKVSFHCKDLLDVAERRTPLFDRTEALLPPTTTIVLAMELLDNLPHDKIRIKQGGHFIEQAIIQPIQQHTGINKEHEHYGNNIQEVFVPLQDSLLKQVLQTAPIYYRRKYHVTWIPTVACGLLQRLVEERPWSSPQLLLADFDWLPPPELQHVPRHEAQNSTNQRSLWGEGEPLITSMEKLDYECYLRAPELCDWLFPTDFPRLQVFAQTIWNRHHAQQKDALAKRNKMRGEESVTEVISNTKPIVEVHKQSQFLATMGPEQLKCTKGWLTGYSPLLDDFSNCSVLTIMNKPLQ